MQKIKCGVIGVGYLGRFHAQKYQRLPNAELVAVCDVNHDVCDTVANELHVKSIYDYHALLEEVDAVSIAATTTEHYRIARECLNAGIHVLLEKPITETVEQAQELINLADKRQVKLQIGHLERFNSARLALDAYLHQPLFIESQRLAPFNPRGADVNVILDLMIHDIDIIQSIVQSPLERIEAQGAPVLTSDIDIANARLTFANRCVANITASRISFKTERKTRIFQKESYISLDYHLKQFAVFEKGPDEMFPGIPNISQQTHAFEQSDALLEEIKAFISCIENNTTPVVSGVDGMRALETAMAITKQIHAHWQHHGLPKLELSDL